ncbi:hypothetical protein DUNSADRAFT_18500 [Dunaliella salina]|uniref:DNA mismatch repair proteins mutS family domain-containing protein n=1 Tax=Dunaliella salina TaxID=3046 RepID=A0ABQ7GYZ8_DUNSA|nr:hypothetical protein DUNSADRAFT_18500 [Dunaliella salina]|eukprot:KAF5839838.1 hypothetical protein DUNSADRAFT_18500 [Dunaliella salina]
MAAMDALSAVRTYHTAIPLPLLLIRLVFACSLAHIRTAALDALSTVHAYHVALPLPSPLPLPFLGLAFACSLATFGYSGHPQCCPCLLHGLLIAITIAFHLFCVCLLSCSHLRLLRTLSSLSASTMWPYHCHHLSLVLRLPALLPTFTRLPRAPSVLSVRTKYMALPLPLPFLCPVYACSLAHFFHGCSEPPTVLSALTPGTCRCHSLFWSCVCLLSYSHSHGCSKLWQFSAVCAYSNDLPLPLPFICLEVACSLAHILTAALDALSAVCAHHMASLSPLPLPFIRFVFACSLAHIRGSSGRSHRYLRQPFGFAVAIAFHLAVRAYHMAYLKCEDQEEEGEADEDLQRQGAASGCTEGAGSGMDASQGGVQQADENGLGELQLSGSAAEGQDGRDGTGDGDGRDGAADGDVGGSGSQGRSTERSMLRGALLPSPSAAKESLPAHAAERGAGKGALGGAATAAAAGATRITFLYRLQEGAADASFGLNVAAMAGLPNTAVQRAAQRACELRQAIQQGKEAMLQGRSGAATAAGETGECNGQLDDWKAQLPRVAEALRKATSQESQQESQGLLTELKSIQRRLQIAQQ